MTIKQTIFHKGEPPSGTPGKPMFPGKTPKYGYRADDDSFTVDDLANSPQTPAALRQSNQDYLAKYKQGETGEDRERKRKYKEQMDRWTADNPHDHFKRWEQEW